MTSDEQELADLLKDYQDQLITSHANDALRYLGAGTQMQASSKSTLKYDVGDELVNLWTGESFKVVSINVNNPSFPYIVDGLYNGMKNLSYSESELNTGFRIVKTSLPGGSGVGLPVNWNDLLPTFGSFGSPEPKPKSCSHVWKHYTGFTDSFTYCDRCDLKRDKDDK